MPGMPRTNPTRRRLVPAMQPPTGANTMNINRLSTTETKRAILGVIAAAPRRGVTTRLIHQLAAGQTAEPMTHAHIAHRCSQYRAAGLITTTDGDRYHPTAKLARQVDGWPVAPAPREWRADTIEAKTTSWDRCPCGNHKRAENRVCRHCGLANHKRPDLWADAKRIAEEWLADPCTIRELAARLGCGRTLAETILYSQTTPEERADARGYRTQPKRGVAA